MNRKKGQIVNQNRNIKDKPDQKLPEDMVFSYKTSFSSLLDV